VAVAAEEVVAAVAVKVTVTPLLVAPTDLTLVGLTEVVVVVEHVAHHMLDLMPGIFATTLAPPLYLVVVLVMVETVVLVQGMERLAQQAQQVLLALILAHPLAVVVVVETVVMALLSVLLVVLAQMVVILMQAAQEAQEVPLVLQDHL
jgi:hypothetical protein